MQLVSLRIITEDVARLVEFYEHATGLEPHWRAPQFAEFRGPSGTLAIGSAQTMPAAVPGSNRAVIVEFRVEDVDREYARLADHVVQAPATMPWGNRSMLLRDPDGNLVNFFAPPTLDTN
ncbi:VOC family protein [Amycolatopsis jejuensis]|uniref:VOC family protein n=1 Tax=Amycolatopsis jejuensis TaxID=330084 RepID=UPI000525BE6C|nr:VOC family protein [Amycolatopsis jejuensis]